MKERILKKIADLQAEYGLNKAQELMNSGAIWKFEGSVGRAAMELLEMGALMLPEEQTSDYWGNILPSRNELKEGTKGTLNNAQKFWDAVDEKDDETIQYLEQYRNFMSF